MKSIRFRPIRVEPYRGPSKFKPKVAGSPCGCLSIIAPLVLLIPHPGRAQPSNDAFADAQPLSVSAGSVTGSNVGATKEAGEPNHAGNPGGHSVWYRWTAPLSGSATIDTLGSDFDTLLGVYTGNSVSSLTTIASNDDISSTIWQSRVNFTAMAGATYQIAVDGWNGGAGNITLNWTQNLPDLIIWGPSISPRIETVTFSSTSCAVIEGMVQPGTRKLLRFSTETRNQGTADIFLGNPATNPQFVWAPCHGHYHFNNYANYQLLDSNGQSVATGLKIGFCLLDSIRWDANAPSSARYNCGNQGIQQGWGDVYYSTLDGQWIDITGVPDGNYTLEMEVNPQHILPESNYANNITRTPITIGNVPPANDNFVDAGGLSGSSASVSGSNVGATKEAGEPNHAGNAGGHSVWYVWTAPSGARAVVDTIGSGFDTLLAVYTGKSVSALTAVASNDDISSTIWQSRVTLNPLAGTTYYIAVDGWNGATGNIVLTLDQSVANDNFTNCEFIGGANGTVTGSNVGATKEAGEPNHAGNPGGHSIWYCWTAPDTASMSFDTVGSTFDTLLAVYVGNSVDGLAAVASNDDIDSANLQSRVTFTAVATTQYTLGLVLGANSTSSPAKEVDVWGERPTLSYNLLAAGEYELTITGQPLRSYTVEVSYDLIRWTPLATTLADLAGAAYFRDKATMPAHRESPGNSGAGPIQGGPGDPVCDVSSRSAFAGAAGPAKGRFYRVVEAP
ncbi:MAG: hypothetical protein DME21_00610 [Verrucomicrobia bacterium]|nr:MAG: hypothetical protein DME21_00610 [Verrucomicrobiota bacterium]